MKSGKEKLKWRATRGNYKIHLPLSPVSKVNWYMSVLYLCQNGVWALAKPCIQTLPVRRPARVRGLPLMPAVLCQEWTGAQISDMQFAPSWHSLYSQVTPANAALLTSPKRHSFTTQKHKPGSYWLKTLHKCRCGHHKKISNQHVKKCIFIRTAFHPYHLPGHWNALSGS